MGELDELRTDLLKWAIETEDTADEHEAGIADVDNEGKPLDERRKAIAELRRFSAIDYAHKCVCERIISQIDAAREPVAA